MMNNLTLTFKFKHFWKRALLIIVYLLTAYGFSELQGRPIYGNNLAFKKSYNDNFTYEKVGETTWATSESCKEHFNWVSIDGKFNVDSNFRMNSFITILSAFGCMFAAHFAITFMSRLKVKFMINRNLVEIKTHEEVSMKKRIKEPLLAKGNSII